MEGTLKWLFQLDAGFPLTPSEEREMTELSEQTDRLRENAGSHLEEPSASDYLSTLEQLRELERQIAYANGFKRAFQLCTELYQRL